MKWFKHFTDCSENGKFNKLQMIFGRGDDFFAAYGRVWRLFELVGKSEEESEEAFYLPADQMDKLSRQLHYEDPEDLRFFLEALAVVGFIDKEAWDAGRVYIPKMAERADTYTQRRKLVRSTSNTFEHQSIKKKEIEERKEKENQKEKGASLSAASPDKVSDPVVYSGTYFDLKQSVYGRCRSKAQALSDEQFTNLLEALDTYAAENPRKYDRTAAGKLKNPGRIILKWLETEVAKRQRETPNRPPAKVDPIKPDPDCPICNGRGLLPSGPKGLAQGSCDCVKRQVGLKVVQ